MSVPDIKWKSVRADKAIVRSVFVFPEILISLVVDCRRVLVLHIDKKHHMKKNI